MDVASYQPGCAWRTTRFFMCSNQSRSCGFTLLELLVALSILTILISYALPSVSAFIDGQRKIAHLNSMASTLYLARSEAIMRNSEVMVCKSYDGNRCITSGEWEQGWIVFEDRDGNRIHDAEEVILARQKAASGITVYYRAFGSNHYIVFNAQGVTETNGTYTFCDSNGSASARALIVYKTGRSRTSSVRSDGTPLSCPP